MSLPAPSPKQAKLIWFALTGLAISLLTAMGVFLVWGLGLLLGLLSPVLWPLAFAGVIAYLLDPVVDYFEVKGLPRPRAIACVFALALFFLLGLAASVVPQLVTETRELALRIPSYATKLRHRAEKWVTNPPALVRKFLNRPAAPGGSTNAATAPPMETPAEDAGTNPPKLTSTSTTTNRLDSVWDQALDRGTLQSATDWLAKVLPKFGSWIFGQVSKVASWFGVFAGLALVPIYAFYFLLEKKGIESKWTDYLPVAKSDFKDELVFVLKSINAYLIVFFRSQVLVAMCDGVLYTIGFVLIGLPYAVLLGVLAIALTMIPFLGAMATCAMALLLAFVQFGDWQHPAFVLGVFAVVQTLEGLFISPKIMGDRVGLHPLTIIVAVMVGTTVLGGILGGVLAIPFTAAGRVLMFRYVWKKRESDERLPTAAES